MELSMVIIGLLTNCEFLNNKQINWDALSTISTTFLTIVLIGITYWYATQTKKQTEILKTESEKQTNILKIDRCTKEMDLLVAPLYSKIGKTDIFQKGDPGHQNSSMQTHKDYFKFWHEIKNNQYLGSSDLRSALKNYINNKSEKMNDKKDPDYSEAEKELFKAIERRYSELDKILSNK